MLKAKSISKVVVSPGSQRIAQIDPEIGADHDMVERAERILDPRQFVAERVVGHELMATEFLEAQLRWLVAAAVRTRGPRRLGSAKALLRSASESSRKRFWSSCSQRKRSVSGLLLV